MEKMANELITENRIRCFFNEFGNGSERYENDKKITIHTLTKIIDNKFNISYHLKFPQSNVQYNFWFDKLSYLNSNESITISYFNGNEKIEKYKLKTILKTSDFNILKDKVSQLFTQYTN